MKEITMCPHHRTIIVKRGDLDFECRFCKCDTERQTGLESTYKSKLLMMRILLLLFVSFLIIWAVLAIYFFALMFDWG